MQLKHSTTSLNGPLFFSPAFSTPAIWFAIFQSCIFSFPVAVHAAVGLGLRLTLHAAVHAAVGLGLRLRLTLHAAVHAAVGLGLGLDPSAAPPPLFRLARTKSGWRAGAPTKIRLAAAGDFSGGGGGGGIRRDLVNGGKSHY